MEVNPAPRAINRERITLVCFAVKEEATFFRGMVRGHPEVRVVITGMGRQNAERAVRRSLELDLPDLVLSAGFAGALNPELQTGDVIFATENKTELASRLRAAGARPARFHCTRGVITTAEEKRMLRETAGADAVEMESGPICDVCHRLGVSSAIVRVILDTAKEDLPLNFNELMTRDQRLAMGKLALAVVKAPRSIASLVKLHRQSRLAAQTLGEVLLKVIEP